jgi:hypothetical protein
LKRAPEAEEAIREAFELDTSDKEIEKLLEECMMANRTK